MIELLSDAPGRPVPGFARATDVTPINAQTSGCDLQSAVMPVDDTSGTEPPDVYSLPRRGVD
jgi:hypothetical protein